MMEFLTKLLSAGCPVCDGDVVGREGKPVRQRAARIAEQENMEHHVCQRCGVIVVYSRAGWRYPMETELRPLPGMAGLVGGLPSRFAEWRARRRAA